MRTQILHAAVEFFDRPFIKPLKLSTGSITKITEARAVVRVRVDGREAVGRGSIYLSDLWAWPDLAMSHEARDLALRQFCREIASNLKAACGDEPQHPLELGLRLHEHICAADTPVATLLARAMCASPFDAAVHDAVGLALNCSAFDLHRDEIPLPSVDKYFEGCSGSAAIRALLVPPRDTLDAWLIVGANDNLGNSFAATLRKYGYRCFKLKVGGKDNADDVARTVEVFRAAQAAGAINIHLSVDSNEGNPSVAAVVDYLTRLRAADSAAFDALQYLEQPIARDIVANDYDLHEVAALKPVLLDEGLTSLDLLGRVKDRGWSGLALKTCKGHSFVLVAAAWARLHGLLLSMQDLTNPGLAAIHAALFASRIDTINGVELNANQFTPAANADWLPRLSDLLEPRGGVHRLMWTDPPGLGSGL